MRKLVLGAISSLALISAANAGEPAHRWSGFYIGANGGYAWSANTDQFANTTHTPFEGLKPEGGFGGGQIGYNWVGFGHKAFLIGIEADLQGGDISDGQNRGGAGGENYRSKLDWFGTVRGRLGYTIYPSAVVYVTGGWAYGHLKTEIGDPSPEYFKNEEKSGYVLGAGWEHKIGSGMSLKLEYQYLNFGTVIPVSASGQNWNQAHGVSGNMRFVDNDFHTVRVGLNFKLDERRDGPLK